MKRVLIVASVTFVSVMIYQWGHLDGREGLARRGRFRPRLGERGTRRSTCGPRVGFELTPHTKCLLCV